MPPSSRPGDVQQYSTTDYLVQSDNLSISPELLFAEDFVLEFDGGLGGAELFAGLDVDSMGAMGTSTPIGMNGEIQWPAES